MCAPLPMTGITPLASLNSFIFSSPSLRSEMVEEMKSRISGRVERTFWMSGVASDSGGV